MSDSDSRHRQAEDAFGAQVASTYGRAPAAGLAARIGWRMSALSAALRDAFEWELQERAGARWLAVAFGTGAGVYFALPREPALAALLGLTFVLGTAAIVSRARGASSPLVALLAVLLAGASVAKLRTDRLDTPQVEREISVTLSGRVVGREERAELRPRITLDRLRSDAFRPGEAPQRIRLTLAPRYGLPPLGARVSFGARLMPVGGPVTPGGYDPHRSAFFDGIGGSGFVFGGWTLEEEPPPFSVDLAVARMRSAVVERILAVEPGQAGAIAAALLVGEKSALSERSKEDLRIAGLAHILAISGLHMMLVAGTTFFAVRALLALSVRLSLRFPIRKWSALAALVVVSIYFALSGGSAATVRAFVMAGIMFAAILLDRPAISMRNLAIAAFVVIALAPENVVEPGFQMSFGAVAALIAVWEYWRDRKVESLRESPALPGLRFLATGWRMVLGVAVTTIVAGFATAPFAAYHFERVANYSVLGNLLAAPLVSVLIMPFGLLSLLVMPLGLEALPLAVMARGIDALLAIAAWVASLPGAETVAPPIAPLSLLLIVAGMLWLCLWRLGWRFLGVPVIVLGLVTIPLLIDRPDILVAPSGKAVAVRDGEGALRVAGARAGSYVVDQFFDKEGGPPEDAEALRSGTRCDDLACILPTASELEVSHVVDAAAFAEDCGRVAIIVTPLLAPADCAAALVIDAASLARHGAHAIRIDRRDAADVAFRVKTARSETPRPWEATSAE